MKDLPSYIVAKLADVDSKIFREAFRQVVNNGTILRNVVQIARSGRLNKVYNMSAGTFRHAIQEWFGSKTPEHLHKDAIGNNPSMKDVICMARPKPGNASQAMLYRYLIGKKVDVDSLPEPVRSYELYKMGGEIPNVDFRYLTNLPLSTDDWCSIAKNAPWLMTKKNLNTFHRHGVFDSPEMVKTIASRLRDETLIKKAGVFPYELYIAYLASKANMPHEVQEALQDAMEIAVSNTPVFEGKTYIGIDVSGSMHSSITGYRGSATSIVRSVDVAALFASALLRGNQSAKVIPFSDRLYDSDLNSRDTVFTNTKKLSSLPAGGTNCSLVLNHLNANEEKGDIVVYISDNESWIDSNRSWKNPTKMMQEWELFKRRNPAAKMILIDIVQGSTSQVTQREDILQVGGFSDQVFKTINTFLEYGHDTDHWVKEIEKISFEI